MRPIIPIIPRWFAWLLLAMALLSVVGIAGVLFAAEVTLTWQANTESDLAGYRVYQGTVSGQYGQPVTLGTVTTHTVMLPPSPLDRTYFWALTAYDLAGNESAKSNEVSQLIIGVPLVTAPGVPVLTVAAQENELLVAWEPVPDGAGGLATVDVRLGSPTDHWGLLVSQVCPASPCRLTGLTGGTAYQIQAVAFRPGATANVFGALSVPIFVTTPLPDAPPATPAGLQIVSSTARDVVIVASALDCPRVTTSTKGSTVGRRMRTITCAP
jgi:hypothetical protein